MQALLQAVNPATILFACVLAGVGFLLYVLVNFHREGHKTKRHR
jgi:hypothetical protein